MAEEGFFVNKRNQRIFTRAWLPPALEKTKALVFLFHGLGEHSGRYNHVAAAFNARNYAVFALDHHGHGKSDGAPIFVERFEDFVEDALLFIDVAFHGRGDRGAHGQATPEGVGRRGAAIKRGADVNALTVHAARFLSWATPTLGVKRIDPSTLSTDPAQVKAYEEDPLVYHGPVTARMGHELLKAADTIENDFSGFTFPFLACHALDDKLTHPDGSKELYERAPSPVKDLILYGGMRHEIFNERDGARVIADVLRWVEKRYAAVGHSREHGRVISAL
ncbi:lysophospholipaselike protein [Acanthamoeba castellanii str. Neff]|uniref:Lysophospholipaselike protein n=1 Tax=Acanthamoeba castellanii (strain ATCC 30010 / Neff) TaxID=1257118 RepID=L8H3L9_ACACF|nr:lysophospholipaselike protein [Acanthamoeba castellanii str. Neff]ELR19021.1 lysophospholipaselike protein [Acanthamoeba castellanii str. Neff]